MRKLDKSETVEVLASGPIPDVQIDPMHAADVIRTAIRPDDEPPTAPPPKWYRVTRGAVILEGGFRTRIKEGKEINSLNYNIRRLQQQGVGLEEFNPDEIADQFV